MPPTFGLSVGVKLLTLSALALVLLGCEVFESGTDVAQPTPTRVAGAHADGSPITTTLLKTYDHDTVWNRYSDEVTAKFQALPCYSGGNLQDCLRQLMEETGASTSAIDFYEKTGNHLLAYQDGSPVSVGRALPWHGRDVGPTLAFLNGPGDFTWVYDILRSWFEVTPDHPERALKQDPLYETLIAAFPPTPANERYGQWLFPSEEALLESVSVQPSGEEEIVIQVGVHYGCVNCGTGIAERYAFYFGPDGHLRDIKLLGLCEGRPMTRTAPLDGRPYTLQQFGTTTFTDLDGIEECPPQLPL